MGKNRHSLAQELEAERRPREIPMVGRERPVGWWRVGMLKRNCISIKSGGARPCQVFHSTVSGTGSEGV